MFHNEYIGSHNRPHCDVELASALIQIQCQSCNELAGRTLFGMCINVDVFYLLSVFHLLCQAPRWKAMLEISYNTDENEKYTDNGNILFISE